jgi:hypothetical protein
VAGLPDGGPATLAGVKGHLSIPDTRDDTRITAIVAGVNRMVRSWPCSLAAADQDNWTAAPDVVEGATMLAARLFRRKESPAGVESMGPAGVAYVVRNDPDVALLLQLGPYAGPEVG